MDFGTILTLLILILGVAGPVIEKRLKKAGKVDQARKLRDVLDTVLSKDEAEKEEAPEAEPGPGKVLPTPPVTTEKYDPGMPYTTFSVSPELLEGGYRSVKEIAEERRRKYAQSEVKLEPCHSLEIDPKKLVIYSEIMKPKFDDCR